MNHLFKKTSFIVGILTFLAITAFVLDKAKDSNAAIWNINNIPWDNNNFITSDFWALNPSSGDIIKALYGSGDEGSAYTKLRSGYNANTCLIAGMKVVYIPAYTGQNINQIPEYLSGNTIYVLASGTHITSRPININGNCSALIGNGNVKLYSNIQIECMIQNNYNYSIIDNIKINGYHNGTGGYHTYNNCGISLNAQNNTINNLEIYNNKSGSEFEGIGLVLEQTSLNTINNVKIYNNTNGIFLFGTNNNFLNNIQTYNNLYGIKIFNGSYLNTFNNIQTYNNDIDGINISRYNLFGIITKIVLNNIQSYNNGRHGIHITGTLIITGTILHNTKIYNNSGYGIINFGNNDITYYGKNITINNALGATSGNQFITGNAIPELGRTTGSIIDFGFSFDKDFISNPQSSDFQFLIDTGISTDLRRGIQSDYYNNNKITINYLYGEQVLLQRQAVLRSGNTIITGGIYNPNTFVGGEKGVSGNVILPTRSNLTTKIIINRDFQLNNTFLMYKIYGLNLSGGNIEGGGSNPIIKTITFLTGNHREVKKIYVEFLNSLLHNGNPIFSGTTMLDLVLPTFTGTANNTIIRSGGYYNTGVRFTFSDADAGISGATIDSLPYISGTLFTTSGNHIFLVYDNAGNVTGLTFTIDTIPPTFTTSPNIISGGYYSVSVSFTGNDPNFSGITIRYTNPEEGIQTSTRINTTTGSVSSDGRYTISFYDLAENTTGISFIIDKTPPIINGTAFGYSNPIANGGTYYTTGIVLTFSDINFSGATINNTNYTSSPILLTGEGAYLITVADKAGNTSSLTFTLTTPLISTVTYNTGSMKFKNGIRYTNSMGQLIFSANKAATISVTGDFSSPTQPYTTSLIANTPVAYNFTLSSGDGAKWIYTKFTAGGENVFTNNSFYLDTQGPIISSQRQYPNNGQSGLTGNLIFGWTGYDIGIGISGYFYYVSTTGTFTNTIASGFTTNPSFTLPSYQLLSSGTYYRQIVGLDQLGNKGSTGETRNFNYIAILDTDPEPFNFITISGAETNQAYMSNAITITGITPNIYILANLDNGVLYINNTIAGKTGMVKQGDTVKIELISSSEYNKTVTATLTIGNQIGRFRVKTITEESGSTSTISLSTSTKLDIITVFNQIADLYKNNKSKQNEFMITFKSMLKDLIDKMEDEKTLTSTEQRKLAILKYLLELTEKFIKDQDIEGDESYRAPNGKIYIIKYDETKACYTSPNFINQNKCFPTLAGIKNHINANNAAWSHTVDTSRKAQTYQAPNGKTYTILKTTTGKYFSYRFISPKYFNSLKEIQDHIKKNNPKGKGR